MDRTRCPFIGSGAARRMVVTEVVILMACVLIACAICATVLPAAITSHYEENRNFLTAPF